MKFLFDRLLQYALLMRFDKPIGTYLLLWPTLWALWIAAEGDPNDTVALVFLLGVILMRASGCIINDYADRNIDIYIKRTENRPIATGRVSPREAITLFILNCILAFFLVLFTNLLTFMLSFGALVLAIAYPFTKRYTYMPQAFLGLAFGWSIPMAFAAQTEAVPHVAWLLLTATVIWATIYDTMYAMVDREEDVRIGVKSTAILFGDSDRTIIAMLQFTFFMTMLIIGNNLNLGFFYYVGLGAASLLSFYQLFLIRRRDPKRCLQAFKNNNWFGAVIFFGIVLHYYANS